MSQSKRQRAASRTLAAGGALALHLALVAMLAASLGEPPAYLHAYADQASVFASLVPAASLQAAAAPAATPASGLDALSRSLQLPGPAIPAGPARPPGGALLTAMDATAAQARTPADRSQHPPAPPAAVALKDAPNPYEYASVASADPTRVEALWAAIRPCWHGAAGGAIGRSAAIRVVLDPSGQVQDMTLLEGRLEDARSEAAARAIVACAPYRIGAAGAYLARVPA